MNPKVYAYDPTASDSQSAVRGVGRYLQILKENFPEWIYVNNDAVIRFGIGDIFINPFFNFLQPPLTMRRLAKKQIAVVHDLVPLKYPKHFPAGIKGNINIYLNKLALRNYDLVVTDSEASKKDIIGILRLPENIIKVIYPCLPQSFLKIKDSGLNENLKLKIKNFILYVGDATWNKNLVNMARAIKIADVGCVFVGKVFNKDGLNKDSLYRNPWQRELKQFVEETRDDKRFIFPGFVNDAKLFNYYQQASVNLLLSRDEGFGFSWLEAANFSCPTLLSDIPTLTEISDGKALFVNPENPNEIAKKIDNILLEKSLRKKVGEAAYERSRFFSSEKFKDGFLSLIND